MTDRRIAGLLAGWILFLGCSQKPDHWKETFPVTGTVLVDGAPASQLQVILHDVKGLDTANPSLSSTFTDDAGAFSMTTYQFGDGVPAGEYKMTFLWGQLNTVSMQYGGPDRLNGKYEDPDKSEFTVKVEPGKPANLGTIQLTTK
jgi:hypothetical protein